MSDATYIHGTAPAEQDRLAKLGDLTDAAFVQFLDLRPDSVVLDVGSGLGNLARRVAARVPAGEVWGVERSPDQLARAAADRPNLHFRQGDAHALPFDDDRFDVAYCRYVLEHVARPAQVLREMRRVLKPGGAVFVQENNIAAVDFDPDCPNFDRVWRAFMRLQQLLGGDPFVGKRLLRLMTEAGFRDVRLSVQNEVHYHGLPTFRPWVENIIGNILPPEQELISRGLVTADEFRAAVAELRRVADCETGSAFFYWNRAAAVK